MRFKCQLTEHEGRRGSVGSTEQVEVIRGNEDANDERRDAVEDSETPDEATSGLGDVATRSNSLTCTDGNQLGRSDKGETGADEGAPVSKEVTCMPWCTEFFKCSWFFVVPEAEDTILVGTTAEEDDNTQDDKATDGDELDGSKPKLGLTEEANSNDVEEKHNDKDNGDPEGDIDGWIPVVDDDTGSNGFSTDKHGVCIPVVPTGSESERGVDETTDKVGDGYTTHGEIGDHFSEDVHDDVNHQHHRAVAHEEGGGTSARENGARSDEETSSDSTT